jgi:hypothetical protein
MRIAMDTVGVLSRIKDLNNFKQQRVPARLESEVRGVERFHCSFASQRIVSCETIKDALRSQSVAGNESNK